MSDTALLGSLLGVIVALVGVIWGTLKTRIDGQDRGIRRLEEQNTSQETAIGRLIERMTAREQAHAQHREDMHARLDRIESKLDRALNGNRSTTPSPGRYSSEPEKR